MKKQTYAEVNYEEAFTKLKKFVEGYTAVSNETVEKVDKEYADGNLAEDAVAFEHGANLVWSLVKFHLTRMEIECTNIVTDENKS